MAVPCYLGHSSDQKMQYGSRSTIWLDLRRCQNLIAESVDESVDNFIILSTDSTKRGLFTCLIDRTISIIDQATFLLPCRAILDITLIRHAKNALI